MGRSSISFGSFEYLPSLMQTSPFPLWKASASLTQDISVTHGRHLYDQVPLPSTKVQHFKDHLRTYSALTEITRLSRDKPSQSSISIQYFSARNFTTLGGSTLALDFSPMTSNCF